MTVFFALFLQEKCGTISQTPAGMRTSRTDRTFATISSLWPCGNDTCKGWWDTLIIHKGRCSTVCYDFTGSQISNSIHHYLVGNVDSRVLPTHFQRVRCCLVDISKELLAPHFDTIVDAKQESDIRSPYTPCKTVGERRSPVNQELTVPRSTEDSRPRYDETGTRTALMKQKTLQEMFCADAGHLKKTTVLHIDHMNDYKKYTKLLQKWAMQLDVQGCILFPEDARPRPRHVFVVMDAELQCP